MSSKYNSNDMGHMKEQISTNEKPGQNVGFVLRIPDMAVYSKQAV